MARPTVEEYLAAMPGGVVVVKDWRLGQPHLLIADGDIPSGLFAAVQREFPPVTDPEEFVRGYIVPPRVADVVVWERDTAVFVGEDSYLVDFGPIPAWGASMPERAVQLIVKAYAFSEPTLPGRVETAALATGADVVSVLQMALDHFWSAEDLDEYIEAAAAALARTPTSVSNAVR